jgi:hypothetical protein
MRGGDTKRSSEPRGIDPKLTLEPCGGSIHTAPCVWQDVVDDGDGPPLGPHQCGSPYCLKLGTHSSNQHTAYDTSERFNWKAYTNQETKSFIQSFVDKETKQAGSSRAAWLKGRDVSSVANALNVTRRTVLRWLRQPPSATKQLSVRIQLTACEMRWAAEVVVDAGLNRCRLRPNDEPFQALAVACGTPNAKSSYEAVLRSIRRGVNQHFKHAGRSRRGQWLNEGMLPAASRTAKHVAARPPA